MQLAARLLGHIVVVLFIASCTPKGQEGVSVEAGGLLSPVLYRVDGKNGSNTSIDFGEFVLSSPEKVIDIVITNNTKYPYKNLKIELAPQIEGESMAIGFIPNEAGEINFPGLGGTCTDLLLPQTACTVKLFLSPRENRRYNDKILLSFDNIIQQESHQTLTSVLAGELGTLVFTNGRSQYVFGQLVGTSSPTPVVERAETTEFREELELVNAGGLTVRNVSPVLNQECVSALSGTCPPGMESVYSMTHDCPTRMEPGQKCRAIITYLPKNQDPLIGSVPPEIEEIKYNATPRFSYVTGPVNQAAALNGFFRSVSTTIEARFRMATDSVIFDTPIVSGNRDQRTIRINNLGYREGEMRSLIFRDSLNNLIAECVGQGGLYLSCRDHLGHPTTQVNFPFTVKDRNQCIRGSLPAPKMIDVGSGCLFDLIFQPSVAYLTNREFDNWRGELVFDSRWRGQEVIKNVSLFSLTARSLAAARLELINITYNSVSYPIVDGTADLGRLTLQSSNFFKRRGLQFVFKNVGSVAATDLSFRDGGGRTIPLSPSVASLGTNSPSAYNYYANVSASSSTCAIVAPDSFCTLSSQFAPIGLPTNTQEDENMFDGVDLLLRKYKSFHVRYKTGALYTDTNVTTDIPDYANQEVQARLLASLVRKGLLMNPEEDERNVATRGGLVAGDTAHARIYLRNIGTGPIPYIRLATDSALGHTFVPTPDPVSVGAQHDCLNLVDRPPYAGYVFPALPKEESCVFSLVLKTDDSFLRINPFEDSNPSILNVQEMARLFTQDLMNNDGGMGLWEYAKAGTYGSIRWTTAWEYFDGDTSVPLPYPSNYVAGMGLRTNTTDLIHRVNSNTQAKLVPTLPQPWHSATIYRRGYILPAQGALSAHNVAELWLYGNNLNLLNDPLNTSTIVQGDESRFFVPTLSAWSDRNNFDYVIYAGSFPRNSGSIDIPISLTNASASGNNRIARLVGFQTDNVGGQFSVIQSPTTDGSVNVTNDASVPNVMVRFNPAVAGEHRMEVTYSYETGRCLDDLEYENGESQPEDCANPEINTVKLLVLAHVPVDNSYPKLTATLQDYDVTQNASGPPTVSPTTSNSIPLTWNQASTSAGFVMDTLKLSSAATPNDVYALKKITLTNASGLNIPKLSRIYRSNVTSAGQWVAPTSLTFAAGTTCNDGMALGAGASCDVVLRYQPTSADSQVDLVILTLGFDLGNGQYALQNIGFSLMPKAPAALLPYQLTVSGSQTMPPVNISMNTTQGGASVTRSSRALSIGGNQVISATSMIYNFNGTGTSGYRRVELRNTEPTKASLLKSYQNYITENSLRGYSPGSPAPSSLIPDSSEYQTLLGEPYVTIVDKIGGRVKVMASKGCLFGADESNGGVPAHQKGFNNSTPAINACYLIPSLSVGINDIMLNLLTTNADIMRENSARLEYYTVNRGPTAELYFHFTGNFLPPSTTASGSYANVSGTDNRRIRFDLPSVTANSPTIGSIVGLRVLRTTSTTPLNGTGIYATTNNSYVDIRPYNPATTHFAEYTAGLLNGTLYYFKVLAIRYNASFTKHSRFLNLNPGEFLSAVDNGSFGTHPLSVLVPPVGMNYFHTQRRLVERNLTGGIVFDTYSTSSGRCTTRPLLVLKNPNNQTVGYKLINSAMWDLLKANPSATSYSNMLEISHWLSNATVSIDTVFTGVPGFIPSTASQSFDPERLFYLRNGANPTANVNIVVGGVPGTTNSDYVSYVAGTVAFASARCMLELGTNVYGSSPW